MASKKGIPENNNSITDGSASDYLVEFHKRSLGYAYGGPADDWCNPGPANGMNLLVDKNDLKSKSLLFKGCGKYSTCKLITNEIRWKPWNDLNEQEKEELKKTKCYRATKSHWNSEQEKIVESIEASWDSTALPSRQKQSQDSRWIGNPFGIRTKHLGNIILKARERGEDVTSHRDVAPCPAGGCVTPEMQRDYLWEKIGETINQETIINQNWKNAKSCPFFFRHTNEEMTEAKPNLQRFAQCYLTLPDIRTLFEEAGLLMTAPIFRASSSAGSGDSYWYSFYSGFSFLQLLSHMPNSKGWEHIPVSMRWQATAYSRQNTNRSTSTPPINRLLRSVESGEILDDWENNERIFSISDGFASAILLQWVIIQRLKAVCKNGQNSINVFEKLDWIYEDENTIDDGLINKLESLGYRMETYFSFKKDLEGRIFRNSDIIDDLQLLGLLDPQKKGTGRLVHCINWLLSRSSNPASDQKDVFKQAIQKWLTPLKEDIEDLSSSSLIYPNLTSALSLCEILLHACLKEEDDQPISHSNSVSQQSIINHPEKIISKLKIFETAIFQHICLLLPKLHIIVRAFGVSPVRWLFVPSSYESKGQAESGSISPRIHGGMILLMEDNIKSQAYDFALMSKEDLVISKLKSILPFLLMIVNIEEENVREEHIKSMELFEIHQNDSKTMGHYIGTLKKELSNIENPSTIFINNLLYVLERRFKMLPSINYQTRERVKISYDLKNQLEITMATFKEYLSYSEVRSNLLIQIVPELVGDYFFAEITPKNGYYDLDDILKTVQDDFTMFINDLIFQRISQGERMILLRIISQPDIADRKTVTFEVIAKPLPEKLIWKHPPEFIERWPIGRGFYSTFFTAKSLGAIEMEIANREEPLFGDAGVISFKFQGGKS